MAAIRVTLPEFRYTIRDDDVSTGWNTELDSPWKGKWRKISAVARKERMLQKEVVE